MKLKTILFIILFLTVKLSAHEETSRQMGALAEIIKKPDLLKLKFTYHIDDLETILNIDLNKTLFSERKILPNDNLKKNIIFTAPEPINVNYSELKAKSPVIYTLDVNIPLKNTTKNIMMHYHFIKNHSGSDRLAIFWEHIDKVLYLHDNYKEVLIDVKNLSIKSNKIIFPETQPSKFILFLLIAIVSCIIVYFPGAASKLIRRTNVKS